MTTPTDAPAPAAGEPSAAEPQTTPPEANEPASPGNEPVDPPAEPVVDEEANEPGTGAGEEATAATYEGLALSEGSLLEEADLSVVREFAQSNTLSEDQAAAFLAYEEQRAQRVSADFDALTAQWKDAWHADPELGGSDENRSRTQGFVRAALAKYAPEGSADFLAGTGYEDHPVVVALLRNVGAAMSEPEAIVHGGRTGDTKGPNYAKRYPNSHADMEKAAAAHRAAAGA